jgi:tetratricopeptide (TPR) repeat protein
MHKLLRTIFFFLLLASILSVDTHASKDAAKNSPVNMSQAILDTDQTGISVDDPLAQKKLRRLIKLKQSKDPFIEDAYLPLRQLGILMQRGNDFTESIDVFQEMQHLVHRHYGVYSPLQIESVDLLIESFAELHDYNHLDQLQHFRYRVLMHNYKPGETKYLVGTLRLADWYRNSMQYQSARQLYQRSHELIVGEDIDLQIRILRSVALTHYLSGICCVEEKIGEAYELSLQTDLDGEEEKRAMQDYINAVFLTSTNIEKNNLKDLDVIYSSGPEMLGFRNQRDFMLVADQDNLLGLDVGAPTTYVPTSDIIEFSIPKDPASVTLGSPVVLCGESVDNLVRGRSDDLYADVKLTVDTRGQAEDIELAGNAPLKLMRYLRKALRKIRFRPAMKKGGELSSSELAFRQTFSSSKNSVSGQSEVSRWSEMMARHSCGILANL